MLQRARTPPPREAAWQPPKGGPSAALSGLLPHTERADCGQAVLCASGSGGKWERCLVGRCGSAEQHGEHRQDGAEARKPWQPSLAAAGAHTPTSPMDGRAAPMAGLLSRPRAAAPELADAIRDPSHMRRGHEQVASAELVERWRTRGSPRRGVTSERFVADSRQKLVELPASCHFPAIHTITSS